MRRFTVWFLISFFCFIQPLVCRASLADDLQKQIQERQSQIQELEKQIIQYRDAIKNKKSKASTLQNEIQKIESQIRYLEIQIRLTQTQISQTNLKIEGLSSDIQTQEIAVNKQKNNIGMILRAIYEYDQESPLVLVLKNENFSDFLNQVQFIQNLQNSAQEKLTEIKNLKQNLEVQKIEQGNQKTSLESLKNRLGGQTTALDGQKDEKKGLLTSTKNQEKQYQAVLSDLQKKREQIEREIYVIEEKLRLAIDPNSIPDAKKGLLAWPAKGSLTQNYGCLETQFAKRSYPTCDNGRGGFHNGIDVDIDMGDPITATLNGAVSGVGNLGKYSYGKWVTITHENGLTTLYAHLSSQTVSVGQKVKEGQIIGYGGSSGYSTGSHLHFSVYATNTFKIEQKWYGPVPLGGTLNPLSYL